MRASPLAISRDSQTGPLAVVLPAELPPDVRDKLDVLEATSEEEDPLFRPLPAIKPAPRERSGPVSTPRVVPLPAPPTGRSRFLALAVIGMVATVVGLTLTFLGPRAMRTSAEDAQRSALHADRPTPAPPARPALRTVAAAPPVVATTPPLVSEGPEKNQPKVASPPPAATGKPPTQLEERRTFGD